MSRYMTLGSSSPGAPSLRGVPRRPRASTTARARCVPSGVATSNVPSSAAAPTRLLAEVDVQARAPGPAPPSAPGSPPSGTPRGRAGRGGEASTGCSSTIFRRGIVEERAAQVRLLLQDDVGEAALHAGSAAERPAGPAPTISTSTTSRGGGVRTAGAPRCAPPRGGPGRSRSRPGPGRGPRRPGTGPGCPSRSTRPPAACRRGTEVSQAHLDGAHRAGVLAAGVPDAAQAVDHRGRPAHHAQHVALRAGGHAGAAADAHAGVDLGELGGGAVHAELRGLDACAPGRGAGGGGRTRAYGTTTTGTTAPPRTRSRTASVSPPPSEPVPRFERSARSPSRSSPTAYSRSARRNAWRANGP